MKIVQALALAVLAAAPALAQEAAEPVTPASVVASAPASDWRAIDPVDLLVMTLAPDRDGEPRQVVIQLMPPPFSQGWVGNIRTLATAHWWDGTTVYRVVDNWVAQWGDGEDDKAKAKPLPEGVVSPTASYETLIPDPTVDASDLELFMRRIYGKDPYSNGLFFFEGFPIAYWKTIGEVSYQDDAGNPLPNPLEGQESAWPIHCYASVGVARDLSPDTGTGAELYAVIGHAPRQLDRNIAVVGRVIEGIEHLSTLPRGKGDAGVYDDPALRVPIVSVRLASEVQEFPQPRFEYLASDSESFASYVAVRADRNDAFYKVGAGGIDVCNVQVPIRRMVTE